MLKVLKFSNHKTWDEFVDFSNNGTIFHKQLFLSYHSPKKFKFCHLLFYQNNKLVAVLPGSLEKGIFKSPTGASYGSFAVPNLTFSEYEELLDSFIKYAKKEKIKEIFLTPPPTIYMEKPNEIEKFLLEYKGFKVKYHLITNAVDLMTLGQRENILENVEKRFRNDIILSKKRQLIIKITSDINAFYPILLENKLKFKTTPTHTLDELLQLKQLFPKDILLFMAYDPKNKLPVAGILLFLTNKTTALVFYISMNYKYKNQKPVSRLLYEIILFLRKKHYRWLDLGVSMDTFSDNPMEPSRNLIFFKEAIKTRGFLRTTYWKKI